MSLGGNVLATASSPVVVAACFTWTAETDIQLWRLIVASDARVGEMSLRFLPSPVFGSL
jgi:hypothetical protein